MSSAELNAKIASELEHIPRGPIWGPQNKLRMVYNVERRQSLGKNAMSTPSTLAQLMGSRPVAKSAGEVLQECIAFIQQTDGVIDFQYDETFFGETAVQN